MVHLGKHEICITVQKKHFRFNLDIQVSILSQNVFFGSTMFLFILTMHWQLYNTDQSMNEYIYHDMTEIIHKTQINIVQKNMAPKHDHHCVGLRTLK
jgi:hypothetical protein